MYICTLFHKEYPQRMPTLKEYLDEIKDILRSSNEPNEIDRASIQLSKNSYRIAKASMLISGVFGIIGVIMIVFQIQSSVQVSRFNELLAKDSTLIELSIKHVKKVDSTNEDLIRLLGKIDTVMHVTDTELALNQKQQAIANRNYGISEIGYMNQLYSRALFMNAYAFGVTYTLRKMTVRLRLQVM